MKKKSIRTATLGLVLLLAAGNGWGASQISRSVIASGGGKATSANHQLIATLGQPVVGLSISTNHTVHAGFWTGAVGTPTDVGGGDPDVSAAPLAFRLYQNVPNPFNPITAISYAIPSSGTVRLAIHDARGRVVAVLVDGLQPGGRYNAVWDGRSNRGTKVTSGVYFSRLVFDGQLLTQKLVLAK